jgi:hypothetical protein
LTSANTRHAPQGRPAGRGARHSAPRGRKVRFTIQHAVNHSPGRVRNQCPVTFLDPRRHFCEKFYIHHLWSSTNQKSVKFCLKVSNPCLAPSLLGDISVVLPPLESANSVKGQARSAMPTYPTAKRYTQTSDAPWFDRFPPHSPTRTVQSCGIYAKNRGKREFPPRSEKFVFDSLQDRETWYHQGRWFWPLLCSGPAVSLHRERRGFYLS